ENVWITRIQRIGCLARRHCARSGVDVAVCALVIVSKCTPAGVDDRYGLLYLHRGPRLRCPIPAIAADFAGVQEVIQRHKLARKLMMVRAYGLRKNDKRRIAVSYFQIAEHLIIRTVLLHHVDHVLDALAQEGNNSALFVGLCQAESIILCHALSQIFQRTAFGGRDNRKTCFSELPDILIGGVAWNVISCDSSLIPATLGIWPGVALAIHHI